MVRRFPNYGNFSIVSPGFFSCIGCLGICLDAACQEVNVLSSGVVDLRDAGVFVIDSIGLQSPKKQKAGWNQEKNRALCANESALLPCK